MKICLIVVPHQDDETNLVGNILSRLTKLYEVFVVYSSLDSNLEKGAIRKREATNACNVWSIDEKHVIFLEFPDTPNKIGHHFYTDGNHKIVTNLVELIELYRPELIIGTDFDFHSDHRMISLALDEAIGTILLKQAKRDYVTYEKLYYPICLKGFCYETAYYGIEDYRPFALGTTKVKENLLSNPSYEWEKRISIPSSDVDDFIWNKKAFKALKCHDSQYAILRARSIINADNVFWQRRTDNLLYNAKLSVSSGNAEKLRDFMILDTDDIITQDPCQIDYSKALWVPDASDKNPEIHIRFDGLVEIGTIILHGAIANGEDSAVHIEVIVNSDRTIECSGIRAYGRSTEITINQEDVRDIIIRFESFNFYNFGVGELEIFSKEVQGDVELESLIDCNGRIAATQISKKKLMCLMDVFGFGMIVIKTKVKRKIRRLFAI